MKLVVVESPNKIKHISKYLGAGYKVMATVGHFRDLPKKSLGVDDKFNATYEIQNIDVAQKLWSATANATEILIATDPDREGEAIGWHVYQILKKSGKKFTRIYFREITDKGIKAGISNPTQLDLHLVAAQQARRIIDRLAGYKISPIIQNVFKQRTLSAGRVQSVVLRIICERQAEIDGFIIEDYWKVHGIFEKDGKEFKATLLENGKGEAERFKTEEEAKAVAENFAKLLYKVFSYNRKPKEKKPNPPFTTSTLQQDGSSKLSFSVDKTMSLAQKLFEAGYITYHRTDSLRSSEDFINDTRKHILDTYGEAYLPAKPHIYKNKDSSQDAHEAIRPTDLKQNMLEIVNQDEKALYKLIFDRFLASQFKNAIYDAFVLIVSDSKEENKFKLTGSKIVFDGFLKLYKEDENKEEDEQEKFIDFPTVDAGDTLNALDFTRTQHYTKPKPQFTEKTLVQIMEKEGVGRPSTYANTISGLKKRSYVEVKAKYFFPTDLGKAVNEHLVKNFPDIMEIKFTKKMELDLDQVAEAKLSYKTVIGEFGKILFDQLAKLDTPDTGAKCPLCKVGNMTEKNGRLGSFYSCDRYPECKFTISGEFRKEKITHAMVKKICLPQGTSDIIQFKKADGGTYEGVILLKDNKIEFQFASSNSRKEKNN